MQFLKLKKYLDLNFGNKFEIEDWNVFANETIRRMQRALSPQQTTTLDYVYT